MMIGSDGLVDDRDHGPLTLLSTIGEYVSMIWELLESAPMEPRLHALLKVPDPTPLATLHRILTTSPKKIKRYSHHAHISLDAFAEALATCQRHAMDALVRILQLCAGQGPKLVELVRVQIEHYNYVDLALRHVARASANASSEI